MSNLENKLMEEVARFNAINKYAKKLMNEQEAPVGGELPPLPAGPEETPAPEEAPAPEAAPEAPAADESTEEIDITDLVNMTKSIKKDIEDNKAEHDGVVTKMDDLFGKLGDLEQKLSQMDMVIAKIDDLGAKVEAVKEPTPQEKLEMRSLDSYPFNQKPQDFFTQKQGEMAASGKHEYVLTKQDVNDYSKEMIRNTFNPETQEDEFSF
jgi:hypothetical protein